MTVNLWPYGLVTALVTPLTNDELDLTALAAVIEFQIANGANGLVVSGGTGEYFALSFEERSRLIGEAVRIADGRVPIIAATGCLTTRDAIRLTQDAQKAGATGALVASPYAEGLNWTERFNFYGELGAAVPLPIMIYNTPPSGLLTFDQIEALSVLPNVSAVKDSSGDAELMGDLVAWATPLDFGVYVGKDALLFDAIITGARGAVFGAANFIPGELSWLIATLQREGPSPEARRRWQPLRQLLRLTEVSPNYIALCKAGCKLRGIDVGEVRRPFLMPQDDEIAQLADLIGQLD